MRRTMRRIMQEYRGTLSTIALVVGILVCGGLCVRMREGMLILSLALLAAFKVFERHVRRPELLKEGRR